MGHVLSEHGNPTEVKVNAVVNARECSQCVCV